MPFLKKYIKTYWKLFSLAVFCLTLEAVCDLLQPTIMSRIVDKGVAGKDLHYVLGMGAAMLGVTAFGAAAAVSRNILSSNVSQKFGAELRFDLFKKIQYLSFSNLDRFETSSLVTRLTNDVTQVQNFVNGTMRIFVKAPLLCLGSIVMASLLNPRMSPVLAAVVPVIALLIFLSTKTGYPFFVRVQKAIDKVNGVMREYLSGVRVVKAFNRFEFEEQRFMESNRELSSFTTSAMRVMAVFTPCITLAVNMGIVTVIWLGGIRVNAGDMHAGQIIAFINYMTQILFSLMMISFVFTMFVRAKASMERISEVITTENLIRETENPAGTAERAGRIDFEHVFFSYTEASEPALKDITFTCMPGETLGIVGSTGSGKSTMAYLIPRFYDVSTGAVRIDGDNVKEMGTGSLREMISLVPQKPLLFTGTILENIRWGRENAGMEDIVAAAKAAQAHDFISAFPEGYDTVLGQGGVNLSGGQKQRISIARALVRKPRILIFDDATSAVDVITETKIRESLRELSDGITCIVIAQRVTSVINADRIIVLDNGVISGSGRHEELMESSEVYRDIFRSQIGKEGIKNG